MSHRRAMRYKEYAKDIENLIKRVDDPKAVQKAFRGARMRANGLGREVQFAIDDLKEYSDIELEIDSEPMDTRMIARF